MKLSTLNGKLNLLAIGTNSKTAKGDSDTVLTSILYLAPGLISGYEVCPSRTDGCTSSCLFTAGRGAMTSVQSARTRKTRLFFEDRKAFLEKLHEDLSLFEAYCKENKVKGYVRLNGTSDIKWEDFVDMEMYSLFFYDYTKRSDRNFTKLPKNYKLTFSRSEEHSDKFLSKMIKVVNVAAVYDVVPEQWLIGGKDVPVIQGDLTDLRYEDPQGVVVGLKAKGAAKKDTSGFVIRGIA